MTSVSKNGYIGKLDDIPNKHNNTHHKNIKTKPVDVKSNMYIDSSKKIKAFRSSGMHGITWKSIWQYGNFFNKSKIDRIRSNIQKTGAKLFIRFRSTYILSFVNRERNWKYLQKPSIYDFCKSLCKVVLL